MSESTLSAAPNVIYKPVPGFPRYRVGSDGSVWSRCLLFEKGVRGFVRDATQTEWKRLKVSPAKKGYLQLNLRANGITRHFLLHQLVALCFIGPRPNGMETCHNDGNPANNNISNLRYGTYADNRADMIKHDRATGAKCPLRGDRHPQAKLTEDDVKRIRNDVAAGIARSALARQLGVSLDAIRAIVNRRNWSHVL